MFNEFTILIMHNYRIDSTCLAQIYKKILQNKIVSMTKTG